MFLLFWMLCFRFRTWTRERGEPLLVRLYEIGGSRGIFLRQEGFEDIIEDLLSVLWY